MACVFIHHREYFARQETSLFLENLCNSVRFEVPAVVLLNIHICIDLTLCCWVSSSQHVEGLYCLCNSGNYIPDTL